MAVTLLWFEFGLFSPEFMFGPDPLCTNAEVEYLKNTLILETDKCVFT